jgi:hypothetical protein
MIAAQAPHYKFNMTYKYKNQVGESYQLGPAASTAAPAVALASASDPPRQFGSRPLPAQSRNPSPTPALSQLERWSHIISSSFKITEVRDIDLLTIPDRVFALGSFKLEWAPTAAG